MATVAESIGRNIGAFGENLRSPGNVPAEPGRLAELLSSGKLKGGITGLLGWMALSRILEERNRIAEAGIQREAIREQAAGITPERLYYEAALPAAQAQEVEARQALLSHISGGVIGPSLAHGERMIGG